VSTDKNSSSSPHDYALITRGTVDEFGVVQSIEFGKIRRPQLSPERRAQIAEANKRSDRRRELADFNGSRDISQNGAPKRIKNEFPYQKEQQTGVLRHARAR
jgi:hypothetical protein